MGYEAAEGDRLLGVDGAKLRGHLRIPAQDMAAACTYQESEGCGVVDWVRGNTPAMITLTHQGIGGWRQKRKPVAEPRHRRAGRL
ncbi:hypothetical protein QR97_11535 [Streptomyces sp. PBH53]|nr:hypothetical protein QR97_11535 [Streptomyces sp. PBH53]